MVQISIDTKKDSPEEIREIIKYLQGVIGETAPFDSAENSFQDKSLQDTQDSAPAEAFSMFDSPSSSEDFNASDVFGSDEDAPSDVNEDSDDDDPVIEIVEF